MSQHQCVAPDVRLGKDVKLSAFVNLYGCEVDDNTKIGAFVEIQKNAWIGKNVKVSSHTFMSWVTIDDGVFAGRNVPSSRTSAHLRRPKPEPHSLEVDYE